MCLSRTVIMIITTPVGFLQTTELLSQRNMMFLLSRQAVGIQISSKYITAYTANALCYCHWDNVQDWHQFHQY
jgi:hypothetical protein